VPRNPYDRPVIYQVRYYGDPILRKAASPVRKFDQDLKHLARDMIDTMYHFNGIGLAAPQIGISKRIFIAAEIDPVKRAESKDEDPPQTKAEKRERWGVIKEHVMINPKIKQRAGVQYGIDGCLSAPGLYIDEMKRDNEIEVSFQDISGDTHTLSASGHFAHVIQHEFDHLEGILFFDRLPKDEKDLFMSENREALLEMQRDAKSFLKDLKENPDAIRVA
jgi:peptide deformylase